ncbi:MAG: MogA/MoaB family molybdenum cofactor biosynthesis protein [Kineosporiaceae bacterium]
MSAEPRAVVVTVSTRAAAGVYADRSGPVLVEGLRELGFAVPDAVVVADGPPLREALAALLADSPRPAVVLTTGGTGLSPSDLTPDITAEFLDRPVPGIAEALRAAGIAAGVAAAVLSRGVAGLSGGTLLVNVAGSTGACRDALTVLGPVLPHVVDQVRGGDHG